MTSKEFGMGWWDDRYQIWKSKIDAGIIPDYDEKCLHCLEEMGPQMQMQCPMGNQIICARCMQGNVVP